MFRKKPVEIEARKWPNCRNSPKGRDEAAEIVKWIAGPSSDLDDPQQWGCEYFVDAVDGLCLLINTLEGQMKAVHGDWIIKGVNGEFYPCKPDIFEKTYEAA